MKCIVIFIMLASMLLLVVGCSETTLPSGSNTDLTVEALMPDTLALDRYNLDTYTQNMFSGNIMYHESICFVEGKDGLVSDGKLLYMPTQIIQVCSPDLQTVYEEGVDYIVVGKSVIRTENSRIPVFYYNDYCKPYTEEQTSAWIQIAGTDQELIIGNKVLESQVFVTYMHEEVWAGPVATSQLVYLPKVKQKLSNREPLNIVFYGDSITCGYDASGMLETVVRWSDNTLIEACITRAPYMPSWAEMVTAKLRQTYGYDEIIKINRASEGTVSSWGREMASHWINPENPDLVIIAYGMNQPSASKRHIKYDIQAMIETVRGAHPNAEFLLVSCMMPNTVAANFVGHKLAVQEEALYELQEELVDIGIGVVPVHSVFVAMEEQGKKFADYTSNNINHPNDFASRVYAQLILGALEG